MTRPLTAELRRSVAPRAGAAVIAVALGYVFAFTGPRRPLDAAADDQWLPMALWLREVLIVLLPVTASAGVLTGLRESRSRVAELLGAGSVAPERDAELERAVLAGAGTPPCHRPADRISDGARIREGAARAVAIVVPRGAAAPGADGRHGRRRALAPQEQVARVAALRAAALTCSGDLLDVLAG